MKTAVITMVQVKDFPAAWSSLGCVDSQLGGLDRARFILLNDAREHALEAELATLEGTILITPGRNLGVASGRNRLIEAALEWGADLIVSLDDDLYIPSDYLDRVEHHVAALQAGGHRVGVVAPSLVDFAATADALVKTFPPTADGRPELPERSTENIRAALHATYVALDEEHVYHLGVRNWEANYLFPSRYSPAGRAIAAAFGSAAEEDPERELRRSPWARDLIVDGGQHQPIAVDSLPGGASAYTRDLITAIGLHDERFAPFGYEDADFCIRALQSGFTNWWMPSEILIHDIQGRSRQRRTADAAAAKARSRLLLAANHAHPDARLRVLLDQIVLAPFMVADLLRHTDETSDIASIGEAILAYFESYLNAMHSTNGDGSGARLLSNALIGALTVLTPPVPIVKQQFESSARVETHTVSAGPIHATVWSDGPVSGLSGEIPILVRAVIRGDARARTMGWDPLIIDSPGLFRCRIEFTVTDPTSMDTESATLALHRFKLVFEDHDLIRRLETNAAWRNREQSRGYLKSLSSRIIGPERDAVGRFADLSRGPGRLEVVMDPPRPVSRSDLEPLIGNPRRAKRVLGLQVMFTESAHR